MRLALTALHLSMWRLCANALYFLPISRLTYKRNTNTALTNVIMKTFEIFIIFLVSDFKFNTNRFTCTIKTINFLTHHFDIIGLRLTTYLS